MAIGDIYRVRFTQVYALTGPQSNNVFHYQQLTSAGTGTGSEQLLTSFVSFMKPLIEAIQSSQVSTLQVGVENVVPGIDNAYISYAAGAQPGAITGDCLPPFVCWAFRLNRVSSEARNGQKRFMGVPEFDQVDGTATAAHFTERVNLSVGLNTTLGVIGTFNTYKPIIYRIARAEEVIPAKTIPALDAAPFDISTGAFTGISTQNSRKFGHGT